MVKTDNPLPPTRLVSVRLPHHTYDELADVARDAEIGIGDALRWAVELGLQTAFKRKLLPPPDKRSRSPQDPEVRRARASKGGTAGGRGRGKKSKGNGNG